MRLPEKAVPRSYHLSDNDWTPLSQNPCWKSSISTFRDLKRIRIGFGPRSDDLFTISNIAKDKSFVDDLNKERGIVSMRVGFVLRSTEIKPLFWDLFDEKLTLSSLRLEHSTKITPAWVLLQYTHMGVGRHRNNTRDERFITEACTHVNDSILNMTKTRG